MELIARNNYLLFSSASAMNWGHMGSTVSLLTVRETEIWDYRVQSQQTEGNMGQYLLTFLFVLPSTSSVLPVQLYVLFFNCLPLHI